jgi:pimeloyl-ACP methyl ester carboxylesterase
VAAPAEAVLLLHGQPGNARDWERVVAAIGSRARVRAIDRPGWDGRGTPATGLPGNAAAALAALDDWGVERATIAGHSFGAGVAAWLAAFSPGRVERLVLVAPSASTASLYRLDHWLATPVIGELASGAALGSAGIVLSAGFVRRRIAREPVVEADYLRAASQRLRSRATWRAFAVEQRALVRDLPALDPALERIAAPTTIVAGSRDIVVPPSSVRRLAAQIPSARLKLIERAGHLLPFGHADVLAGLIVGTT